MGSVGRVCVKVGDEGVFAEVWRVSECEKME